MARKKSLNFEYLKHSGKILASALYISKYLTKIKNTPLDIENTVHQFILSCDATPSFISLYDYPFATCISVNNQIVHGVPTNAPFKKGDLVSVDIGVSYKGHCTDAARTFIVHSGSAEKKHLISTTQQALDEGIKQAIPGNKVGAISYAIQKEVETAGYRSPLEFGGHGIGRNPHEEPFIPNSGIRNKGPILKSNLCLAIEPIVMAGSIEVFIDQADGYTCYSKDGCLSAHIEDTIIVSEVEPIIITRTTLAEDYI